jgi:hypothetical protein
MGSRAPCSNLSYAFPAGFLPEAAPVCSTSEGPTVGSGVVELLRTGQGMGGGIHRSGIRRSLRRPRSAAPKHVRCRDAPCGCVLLGRLAPGNRTTASVCYGDWMMGGLYCCRSSPFRW